MTNRQSGPLPIWVEAADHIVSKMGATTIAFVLKKPPIFTQSPDELKGAHVTWMKALQVLLPGTAVVIQDWYWESKWKGSPEPTDDSLLSRASDLHYHERPWLDHECYVYITLRPARRNIGAGAAVFYKNLVPPESLSPNAIQEFTTRVRQFERILQDSGYFQCMRLHTDELASTPGRPGLIERYCQLIMPGEPAVLRDWELNDGLRFGDRHCLLHTLADAQDLPPECAPVVGYGPYSSDGNPFSIGNGSTVGLLLACNHIYTQYIFIEHSATVRKALELKGKRMQSLSAHSRENAVNRAAVEAFLDESISGQRLMVKAHFNILSWTDDPRKLPELQNLVGSAISKLGGTPHHETVLAPQIWCAGIPGNAADLPLMETFDTFAEQAACFFVPDTNYHSSISATGVRLGERLYGRPLHVDLSDGPMHTRLIANRNKAIFGASGSGKSFFTNHLMHSNYEQGAHVFIIDIGNSYLGLCSFVDGYYFAYNERNPFQFNPFILAEGERADIEKRESLKTLLLALWKKEDESFLRSEYVALSNAIQGYYEMLDKNPGIFPCFDSFYEYLQDVFAAKLAGEKVKDRDFDIDNFLYVLRPFYQDGEYDYLLNASKNLDLLHQRFIVFELDLIKDHPILFPIVTIIIMEAFLSKMRRLPGVKKIILIEEAWKAIARQGMSEYIKYLFKTVRKFYGEAIVVTQEIEDIINSQIVKQTIINNSDCKILLDQSKFQNRFDELQQLLGLSEKEKTMVLSVNKNNDPALKYKEVFISLGGRWCQVYRTEVSLEEYLVYTTEEPEKVKVLEYAKKYGSFRKGVAELAGAIRSGSVKLMMTGALLLLGLLPSPGARAQFAIAEIIEAAVKKVIVATDLAIQRMQTQTILAQDAQRNVENDMQSTELGEIRDWAARQQELYASYYQELWEVKNALAVFQRVSAIIRQEAELVAGYKKAWSLLRQDPHFSAGDLDHMRQVYGRILDQAGVSMKVLLEVVTGMVTQMDDGDRLTIIDHLSDGVDGNRRDLEAFTQGNILLSLQRSKDQQEMNLVKSFYDIH